MLLQQLLAEATFPTLIAMEKEIKAEIAHRMMQDEDACLKSLERHKAVSKNLQPAQNQQVQAGS